jgi:hypothetical protein
MKTKLSGLCIIGCFLAIPTLYSQEIQSYPLETIAVYREGSGPAELGTIEEGRGVFRAFCPFVCPVFTGFGIE